MIPFITYKENFVIGYSDTIIFVDLGTGKIFNEIKIEPPKSIKEEITTKDEDIESVNSKSEQQQEKLKCVVQHIKISSNNEYLAITTSGKKYLLLYKLATSSSKTNNDKDSIKILSTRCISRASSAITFSYDSKLLLVCDKSGDCCLFDCINFTKPGKWILGHLSIVFDIIFTPNQKYIITCDRDEKIRITNYPNTYEIENYCLGHEEFVSSISLLFSDDRSDDNNLLLSISGDKTMKIWNYINGKKLYDMQLEGSGIKHCVHQITNCNNSKNFIWHIAIVTYELDNMNNLYIYELKCAKSTLEFETKLLSKHNFNSKTIVNLHFMSNNKLYLILIDKNQLIELEVIKYEDLYEIDTTENNLKQYIQTNLKTIEMNDYENVSVWFKKKFDNVGEYLERKKRRLEEKSLSK